jgi:hypothetical protein
MVSAALVLQHLYKNISASFNHYSPWLLLILTLFLRFGCCSSTSVVGGTTYPADCIATTDCVDSTLIDLCGASCQANTAIAKCTNAASPYCAAYELLEIPLTHFACAPTPFIIGLDITPTGVGGGPTGGGTGGISYPGGTIFSTFSAPSLSANSLRSGTGSFSLILESTSSGDSSTSSSSGSSSSASVSVVTTTVKGGVMPTAHAKGIEAMAGVIIGVAAVFM